MASPLRPVEIEGHSEMTAAACCPLGSDRASRSTDLAMMQSSTASEMRRCRAEAAQDRRNRQGKSVQPVSAAGPDRKSTRLNSSHQIISYAVFCLKKKREERHDNST